MLTLGLIINPYSGIGGAVGLKGSDGDAVVAEAFRRGAEKKSEGRAQVALEALLPVRDQVRFISCAGEMGENLLKRLGFSVDCIAYTPGEPTRADDTRAAAELILQQRPDVLVFAGGDGTARDICSVIEDQLPVLGIPAGVKIHSGVYGITPAASGEVLLQLVRGQLVDVREAEVRDLDEEAFRNNVVRARHYGDMRVIESGHFVQAVKQGGVESEDLVIADIAAHIIQTMEPDTLYLIGSGKTTQAIMDELYLANTLLGVDAVADQQLVASDLSESQILQLMQDYPRTVAVVSIMGGQGHVFGRGNQQFSPAILRALGKQNIKVVSTKTKLTGLNGRPLIIDSGDVALDKEWAGTLTVVTGFRDEVVYPLT